MGCGFVLVFMCAVMSCGVLFTVIIFFCFGERWLAVLLSLCVCVFSDQFICYV